MKRNIIISAFLLLALSSSFCAKAQDVLERNDLIYHAIRFPQSNQLNPAFFPVQTTAYVTLPRFNFSFGMPFSYNDLNITQDPTTKRYKLSANRLSELLQDESSKLHANVTLDILGFGFRVKNLFFTFNTSAVVDASLKLPEELFEFLDKGNSNHLGTNNELDINISDLAREISYTKIQIGAGYTLPVIPLTLGAHINILDGIYQVSTDDSHLKLYTADDYSTIRADLDYNLRGAGLLDVETEVGGNDKTQVKVSGMPLNMGFTFDLGAKYEWKGLCLSASLLDVGPGIHWQQNVVKLTNANPNTSITFNGMDLQNLLQGGQLDPDFLKKYGDTLSAMIKPAEVEGEDYWYTIPSKINVGASYTYKDLVRVGLLFHGEWERGLMCAGKGWNATKEDFRFNTTASLSVNVFNWLELMVANSFVFSGPKKDLINPGFGINFAPAGAVQLYLMCDYISDLYLAKDKDVNIFLGLNIMIGKGEK